jgi:hypothetical protein
MLPMSPWALAASHHHYELCAASLETWVYARPFGALLLGQAPVALAHYTDPNLESSFGPPLPPSTSVMCSEPASAGNVLSKSAYLLSILHGCRQIIIRVAQSSFLLTTTVYLCSTGEVPEYSVFNDHKWISHYSPYLCYYTSSCKE